MLITKESNKRWITTIATLVAACATIALVSTAASAAVTSQEQKCLGKLGKSAVKQATGYAKGTAKCRDSDISGKTIGACPDAKGIAKNAKSATKTIGAAEKTCLSACSNLSDLDCITDSDCPAPFGVCTAGVKDNPFDHTRINYPGPYCAQVGVPTISSTTDIGTCTSGLAEQAGVDLVAAIYGSITNASGISADAASCLSRINKAAQKLNSTIAKGVLKCRDNINKGKLALLPAECQAEAKTAAKIAKAEVKLVDTIASNCTDVEIVQLDLCGNGVAGTATVGDAQTCVVAAVAELADTEELSVNRAVTSAATIIEAAFPPAPRCGDNLVNQAPNDAEPLGEECDGADDSACPGLCAPVGDLFACTCTDQPRYRFLADGPATDSDAGWLGPSFDQNISDLAGFTGALLNCDCDAFTGATCTGTSVDPICDVVGAQRPVCEWEAAAGPHCEGDVTTENDPCATNGDCAAGTCEVTPSCDSYSTAPDGIDDDSDCGLCDANASNAGSSCFDDTDCAAQCYPIGGGAATGSCNFQSDCAVGEACQGRCAANRCIITKDGAPLPVVSSSTGVCSETVFKDNITGTLNIVTGEHLFNHSVFSVQHLGESVFRPCPVCGGKCAGGLDENKACTGRCRNSGGTGSLDSCRFDSDCVAVDEICSGDSSDCRDSTCDLRPICLGSVGTPSVAAETPCDITYIDSVFGAMSTDCAANPGINISGQGFPIDYVPGSTSGVVVWDAIEPCTATGYELYDCHCAGIGGRPTQPNSCNPTCDGGANFGRGCGLQGTTCSAGPNVGAACDEEADCPGGACSENPVACSGDTGTCFATAGPCSVDSDCPLQGERCSSTNGLTCSTNGDCGAGTCGDACPGGRCVPLCLPRPGEPGDGICGPDTRKDFIHCTGLEGLTCPAAAANAALLGDCASTCSTSLSPCEAHTDCPTGETCTGPCAARASCEAGADGIMDTSDDFAGAGECARFPTNCLEDPWMKEGGTTINGDGDPTSMLSIGTWCFVATNSALVNNSAGFPGPGVIEKRANGYINVPSLP